MKKNLSFLVMFLLLIVATGSNAFAQKQELSGTILNSDGLPIQFASIQVKGTTRGATSNEQGEFKITASPGEELQVSSVGYGWVLYIDHPDGYTTVYAHCNQFAERIQKLYLDTSYSLRQNEVDILLPKNKLLVQKGEQIAFSGNTGGSSGPHLHFELWKNGVPIDPEEFFNFK